MSQDAPKATKSLQLVSRSTYVKEWLLQALFFVCAFAFVLAVALIFVFVGWKALPIFTDYGFWKFITGTVWSASTKEFGILPLIAGTVLVTLGALALGTPLAVGTAVFLSDVASPRVRAFVRPAVELLAGIPSIVYGFFGIILLARDRRRVLRHAGIRCLHRVDRARHHDRTDHRGALRGRPSLHTRRNP